MYFPTVGLPWVELRKPQILDASQWGKSKASGRYQVWRAKTRPQQAPVSALLEKFHVT